MASSGMNDRSQRVAALSPEKLALLMARTGRQAKPAAERERQTIPRRGPGDPLVLSLAQERMWFVEQLQPGNTAYNVAVAARLRGLPAPQLLGRALAEIARRHEVLQATVQRIDGQPRPVIDPALRPGWCHADLSALPAAAREAAIFRRVEDEVLQPFDLSRGPLLRGLLLALGGDEAVICLTIHHLVADGWSLNVLLREIIEIHQAAVRGDEHRLPALPIQYFDYALWQRRRLASGVLERQLDYWRRRLADSAPSLRLPADRPRPKEADWRGKTVRLVLDPLTAAAVRGWTRRQGVTSFTTALAALQALLCRYSGQRDFNVGTPISGRNQVETEGLIGLFINILAIRGDLAGNPGFAEIARRAHVSVLEAFDNQDLPFQKLVEELQPERGLYQSPFFQVALNRAPLHQPALPGVEVEHLKVERWTARQDLILFLVDDEAGMSFDFELSLGLFDVATIERLAAHFRHLLAAAVAAPERPLAELPLLGDPERHQILVEWSGGAMGGPATGEPREGDPERRFYVLQADLEPLPVGAVGELFVGGSGAVRGFDADPARTSARFLPDPFAAERGEPGARLYRTGEEARLRPDGRIEIVGRDDGAAAAVDLSPLAPLLAAAATAALPAIPPADREQPLLLSFAQRRLWFRDRFDPDSPFEQLAAAWRLRGPLSLPTLAASFAEVVRRHEILRTTFTAESREPRQRIAPRSSAGLELADLAGLPEARREGELRRQLGRGGAGLFDIELGPLWRAALLRLGDEDHVLFLAMHRMTADRRSLAILAGELGAIYAAAVDGRPSPRAGRPIHFADFAAWQRSWSSGENLAAQLAFWRRQLGEAPPLLDLAADRPRPPVLGPRGGRRELTVPRGVAFALARLASDAGATPSIALLTAFQVLLARTSGESDIAVGTARAGREPAETERLIGPFADTLVVRAQLADGTSFEGALRQVRDAALAAEAHRHIPFAQLVEELHPQLTRRPVPLLQASFAFDAAPDGAHERGFPGALRVEPLAAGPPTAGLDLGLTLRQTEGGLAGELTWSAELFDPATAERLAGHLANLLAGIAADPAASLDELPLLGEAERRQLAAWGAAESAAPLGRTIPELFAACVERRPDAEALVFGGERLTYADLDRRANGLARALAGRGVRAGSLVAILAGPSVDFVVAALATLKAGGAYVPLDPGYPQGRLDFMLADTAASVVLLPGGAAADRLAPGVELLRIDGAVPTATAATAATAAPAATGPIAGPPDGDLAYVIYTSGSTGQPKGVAVPHRAVVRLVLGTNYVELGEGERVGHASTVAFDAATFEIWGPLLSGGCVVEIPRQVLLSPGQLGAAIGELGITTLFLTTALFNQVAREAPKTFQPLRNLLFGGEAADPFAVRRVLAAGAPGRLLHVYGPTESTTFALFHRVVRVAEDAATVPIGRPVAGTSLHLLDRHLRPVPVGVEGEILLGGDGLARGYLNRPELTAERFVPDPNGAPGSRLYRTGDLGRFRAGGTLDFAGRTDDQVKLRGFRVEPGEVRSLLLLHPSVRDAAVVATAAGLPDRQLVAYVVGAAGREPDESELQRFLAARLPEHMLPAACVALDRLPLTLGGKLDRRALPPPDPDRARGGRSHVAPRTLVEEMLAGLWAEQLGRDRVGIHDDFFELGGHSLLAAQIVWRAAKMFQVSLPVTTLFESPTVADLAAALEGAMSGAGQTELPPIRGAARGGHLPLSFAQERLWFLAQAAPGEITYNMPFSVRLQGRLATAVLARTMSEIVRRHEMLRTTFPAPKGRPRQQIQPPPAWELPLVDLRRLPEGAAEAEARRIDRGEAARPFDLARELPLRTVLVRLGDETHQVLFTMHHIASDGWSMGVLIREVREIYNAFWHGEPCPLAPLAVQYADFAAWQRDWLSSEGLASHLAYWRRQLAGADADLGLPRRSAPPAAGPREAAVELSLPPALVAELTALGRHQGVTLFMTLLAGFQALLYRYGGRAGLCLGTPISGRNRPELRGLIGFFVNMLVLRADLAGDPGFSDLLRRVRETALAAYVHQELPFQMLVHELRGEREGTQAPLFQAAFALEEDEREPLDLKGLALEATDDVGSAAKFELLLRLRRAGAGLDGVLVYSTAALDGALIATLARQYVNLLRSVAAEPGIRLDAIPLEDEPGATDDPRPPALRHDEIEEFRFEL